MNKAKGDRLEGGRQGWEGGGHGGMKMETTVLEQQLKKVEAINVKKKERKLALGVNGDLVLAKTFGTTLDQ